MPIVTPSDDLIGRDRVVRHLFLMSSSLMPRLWSMYLTMRRQASTPLLTMAAPPCRKMVLASPERQFDRKPHNAQLRSCVQSRDDPSRSHSVRPSPTAAASDAAVIGFSSRSTYWDNMCMAGTFEEKYISIFPFQLSPPLLKLNWNSICPCSRSSNARPFDRLLPMGPQFSGNAKLA